MKTEANGIQINYELSGQDGAPVVMLSHSLASSMVMWNPQLDLLASHFKVLRYDMRGHGGSEAPEGAYTLQLLAEDAVALLDALGIDSVHFVGRLKNPYLTRKGQGTFFTQGDDYPFHPFPDQPGRSKFRT